MLDLYHGNTQKSIISHVKQSCSSEEMFEEMFEHRTENIVNQQGQGALMKQLKFIYAWGEKAYFLFIHRPVLSQEGGRPETRMKTVRANPDDRIDIANLSTEFLRRIVGDMMFVCSLVNLVSQKSKSA